MVRLALVAMTAAASVVSGAATLPPPTLPPPPSAEQDPVAGLVPLIARGPASSEPADRAAAVSALLAQPTYPVAAADPIDSLCAAVALTTALTGAGRWEHNGESIGEQAMQVQPAPGFGSCIGSADDPLAAGTYQFIVEGPTGAVSAAGTFVNGAAPMPTRLVNNSDQTLCLVQSSPRDARYYDTYRLDAPWAPGETLDVRLAAVDQELRAYGCPASGDLADADVEYSLRFAPDGSVVPLIASDATTSASTVA